MVLTTIYFQLHQPYRINPEFNYQNKNFLWNNINKEVFEKVANKCYIPATQMFTKLIEENPEFKITMSISGTLLEQSKQYGKKKLDIILELQKLYDAGKKNNQVEFLDETYYHSMVSLFGDKQRDEFRQQVKMHSDMMMNLFGDKPTSFRNTELWYNNDIANVVEELGYKSILCEYRSDMDFVNNKTGERINQTHNVFKSKSSNLIVIPRHRDLSDDVAYRFNDKPITSETYSENIAKIDGPLVMLGYDYEHIGEHLWKDSTKKDIFDFWKTLPEAMSKQKNVKFANPSELVELFKNVDCPTVNIHGLSTSSWADKDKDTKGWLGTNMQKILFEDLEKLEVTVKKAGGEPLNFWRYLTTSCHFHNMYSSLDPDGEVHNYFSAYDSAEQSSRIYAKALDYIEMIIKK